MSAATATDKTTETLCVWCAPPAPALGARAAHVWRIRLDDRNTDDSWTLLSDEEQERARRFHFDAHRHRFVVAHGAMRRILASYLGAHPRALEFAVGQFGKPWLLRFSGPDALEFNLSHSGDIGLLAVSRGGPVGVDVERWRTGIEHVELANRFFSPRERQALRALEGDRMRVTAGFFAAWSRKEAYLKAGGHGIRRGLDHFDVSLEPGVPARLIADQLDGVATERWVMRALAVEKGYSAAVVVAAPIDEILLFDAAPR